MLQIVNRAKVSDSAKIRAHCTTFKWIFESFSRSINSTLSSFSWDRDQVWIELVSQTGIFLCCLLYTFMLWVIFVCIFTKKKLVDLKLFASWAVTNFLEILRRLTVITSPIWSLFLLIPLRSTYDWNGLILIKLIYRKRLRHFFWGCTHFLHNKGNLLGEKVGMLRNQLASCMESKMCNQLCNLQSLQAGSGRHNQQCSWLCYSQCAMYLASLGPGSLNHPTSISDCTLGPEKMNMAENSTIAFIFQFKAVICRKNNNNSNNR